MVSSIAVNIQNIIAVIIVLMFPIPLVHLWLHALLSWWRKNHRSYYIWFLGTYGVSSVGWYIVLPLDRILIAPCFQSFVIGVLMMIGGGALALWSFITLGPRQFLMFEALQPSDKNAVRTATGPFRFFPHPAYLGYCSVVLGVTFLYTSWVTLAMMLYTFTLIPIVIFFEEQELRKRLQSTLHDRNVSV